MKILMKILSILILVTAVIATASILIDPNTIDEGLYTFCYRMRETFTINIIFIFSMAICCYCLERNDNNYLLRILPIYCIIPIIITAILEYFNMSKETTEAMVNIFNFFAATELWVLALSLILVIKPNNQISKIIHYIAYGAIAINIVLSLVVATKSSMVNQLPNVYGSNKYGGFNFSTVEETENLAKTIYDVSVAVELFAILLLFTTNYAFSDKIELEVENIDFDELKEEAEKLTKNQMTSKYNAKKKKAAQAAAVKKIEEKEEQQDDALDNFAPVVNEPVANDSLGYEISPQAQSVEQPTQKQASIISNATKTINVETLDTPATKAPQNKFVIDEEQQTQVPQQPTEEQNKGKFIQ